MVGEEPVQTAVPTPIARDERLELAAALARIEQLRTERTLGSIAGWAELTERIEEELALIARIRWQLGEPDYGSHS
jgi:hypothetical protein